MSAATKFVPLLQRSGPGRWWRWQNKITGAAAYATFGTEHSSRVPRLDYLDLEVPDLEVSSKPHFLRNECIGSSSRGLCTVSVHGKEFPVEFSEEMLGTSQYSSTMLSEAMKMLPMLPMRKIESIIPYVSMTKIVNMREGKSYLE